MHIVRELMHEQDNELTTTTPLAPFIWTPSPKLHELSRSHALWVLIFITQPIISLTCYDTEQQTHWHKQTGSQSVDL